MTSKEDKEAQQKLNELEARGKKISKSLTQSEIKKFEEVSSEDPKERIKRKQLTDEEYKEIIAKKEEAKKRMKEIKGTDEKGISAFNGRKINPWGIGDVGSQGPPMLVNDNPKDLNPTSSINEKIAKFNKQFRGDPRVLVEDGKFTYSPENLKTDQAWARGDRFSPIDGRTPLNGWLFRKIFPKVDPSSPFREPVGAGPPTAVNPDAIAGASTNEDSNSGENALINLTESLKLNQISPARAAEQAIALLVGPIQRAMNDGSEQIELWKDDLYNAIDVPQRGKGIFRDFIASQIYSLAASSINLLTSSGCGDEEDDPAVVAAKAEAIKLSLLRDTDFSNSVDNLTNNMQESLVRGLIYIKNLGLSLLSYFPAYGPTIQLVINQVIAAVRQAISDIHGLGQLGDITGTVAQIAEAQKQGVCDAMETAAKGAITGKPKSGDGASTGGDSQSGGGKKDLSEDDLHILTDLCIQNGGGGDENVSDEILEESDKFKILTDTMINTLNSLKRTPEFNDAMTKAAIKISESTNKLNPEDNNYENFINAREKFQTGGKRKHNKFTKKYIKKSKKNKTKKRVLLKYKKHKNGDFYKIKKIKNIN